MTREATLPETAGSRVDEVESLRDQVAQLESRVHAGEQRRRAMLHIMGDLADTNRRLNDQRRAMLHILVDYEKDRKDLASQTDRLNNSRRALMHILEDAHESNARLSNSRKAMIHIMGDLRETTEEIRSRERELRDKQEQLVQAAKLATLGELTTGIAHELNNPLNNIALYIGNVLDRVNYNLRDEGRMEHDLASAMSQVHKANEIISHLRTFGRTAPASRDSVDINAVILGASSLLKEQLRLWQVELRLDLDRRQPYTTGNAIQLEQVIMNLLTNARDAVLAMEQRVISISTQVIDGQIVIRVEDSGPGIPQELEQKIFDPFFTTKEVGKGTGLGLSIVYGIMKDHGGSISLSAGQSGGACFIIELPLERPANDD